MNKERLLNIDAFAAGSTHNRNTWNIKYRRDILFEESNIDCFANLKYYLNKDGIKNKDKIHTITLFINKNNTPYEIRDINKYLGEVNQMEVFYRCCARTNKNTRTYEISFKCNLLDITRIVTTLSMLRYLYEDTFIHIPYNLIELSKLYPKLNKLLLLNVAHHSYLMFPFMRDTDYCAFINNNHSIMYSNIINLDVKHILSIICEGRIQSAFLSNGILYIPSQIKMDILNKLKEHEEDKNLCGRWSN